MTISDIIQLLLLLITIISTISAIAISVKTLKQNNKMIEESSRAHIVFYVEHFRHSNKFFLTIKNFGNSKGVLNNIKINPELEYSKIQGWEDEPCRKVLTQSKNIILAPNQKITSWFSFENYPDKIFDVELEYETLGKMYIEKYKIDMNYIQNIESLRKFVFDDTDKTCKTVLYAINDSIQELIEKVDK